jgi:hypothetical protein
MVKILGRCLGLSRGRCFPNTALAVYITTRDTLRSCHTPPHSMSPPAPEGDSPIWPLFQTVLGVGTRTTSSPVVSLTVLISQSIVQVTLVCISGYVLARRGILDKLTQKVVTFIFHLILLTDLSCSQQLNVINVNFFTPCLLFSKVAFFLSPGPPPSSYTLPMAHTLSRKVGRTMDHPHLLLACHWRFIRSSLAPR